MSLRERIRMVVSRLRPSGNTAQRAGKSAVWLGSQNVLGRLFQLTTLAVLARLVGPAELGLVGIALLTLSAIRKFTNIGLNTALIQKVEEDVDSHLNTTWLLEIARGTLIFGVMFAVAPYVADLVFSEPRATALIRATALSPLLLGIRNPGVVYFKKNLEFEKQFVYKLSGDATQLIVGIGYALVEPTAWAFVIGYVAGDAVKLPLSYVVHGYRPWPSFDLEIAKELVGYGKWLTGSSILYFLYSEGDDVFVGWLLTPTALAYYQYTYRFSNAPATELSQVVSGVMFPAFSKLQSDEEQFRDAVLRTVRVTSLIGFSSAFGIIAVAPTFVLAVFGEAWLPAVPAMQVLAVYGMLRCIGRTFGQVWKTIGRPDYITKLSALRVVLIAIAIYPMTAEFGILGTALTVTGIFVFPMMPLDVHITARAIDAPARDLYYEFVFPLLASLVMWAVVRSARVALDVNPFVELAVLIPLGIAVFAGAVLVIERPVQWNVTDEFKQIARNIVS
ncbi:lipopolysaccharide biosynthesis protein [Halobaculum halobium]|uniref:Lipopolysaccharide biosynthesis protein n=1 Tax=Halobaculum halobium TaxID=3032281 RepID=A0ABD5T5Y0_9EURY|nr:lipopolysaccharide biosynthesis protein [Halobaculum sp. SYNS20]